MIKSQGFCSEWVFVYSIIQFIESIVQSTAEGVRTVWLMRRMPMSVLSVSVLKVSSTTASSVSGKRERERERGREEKGGTQCVRERTRGRKRGRTVGR
jgi:hypothetical protein